MSDDEEYKRLQKFIADEPERIRKDMEWFYSIPAIKANPRMMMPDPRHKKNYRIRPSLVFVKEDGSFYMNTIKEEQLQKEQNHAQRLEMMNRENSTETTPDERRLCECPHCHNRRKLIKGYFGHYLRCEKCDSLYKVKPLPPPEPKKPILVTLAVYLIAVPFLAILWVPWKIYTLLVENLGGGDVHYRP